MRLADPCLVVLVGASGAGKSTWAIEQFGRWRVVATDDLRAVVGLAEHDQRASKDAFDLQERIADARLRRGFTTVLDSTGLERARRRRWVDLARRRGVPVHAVVFDVDAKVVRARNRDRQRSVPADVLRAQLRSLPAAVGSLTDEGFDAIWSPGDVELVPPRFLDAPTAAIRQREMPMPLSFGLQIGRFAWPGGAAELAPRLAELARAAEDAGFDSIWLMDHLLQIPQIGREWEDLPESWTTLGYLAAVTRTARLGTLVTNVGLRNPAHLAKIVATLDALSGGRAWCGLGAGWFEREHELYGYGADHLDTRFARLEDALRLLPLLWGKGSPPFEGRTISTPAATCYPRPLQERIPILVGGGGEERTLRLVAEHADGTNLFGEPADVAAKLAVLARHCDAIGRDPASITVTHFGEAAVLSAGAERAVDGSEGHAATVEEHVGRFRAFAEAGVTHAIVALPADGTPAAVRAFAPVVRAFATS
ncbi:MAG: TIGR03560 family F420-dependent LLM class oxidoreductase [Actinomycetota bacterium]|nr:TIGR03560 family F420-dependent LLM class oxidoreductase [Actinomycetota bacterium]